MSLAELLGVATVMVTETMGTGDNGDGDGGSGDDDGDDGGRRVPDEVK